MTAAKKFTFDRVFDSAIPLPAAIQAEEISAKDAEAEAEPEAPTFSEAELAAAREEAHAQGREEGLKEQADAIERQTMDILGAINTQLGELFAMEQATKEERASQAVAVAVTIVRKLFPHMEDKHGLKEVEDLVKRTLSEVCEEPKVTIIVHPDTFDILKARMDSITTDTRFDGTIDIQTDDTLSASDCRMAWGRGGVERQAADLWQQVDEIIEINLGTPAIQGEPIMENQPTVEEPAVETDASDETDDDAPNTGDDHG